MKTYYDEELKDEVYYVSDIIDVRDVEAVADYKLLVTFSNDEKRLYDMKPHLDKICYIPLKNLELFNTVHVDDGFVVWNDEIDICPERLYEDSELVANS